LVLQFVRKLRMLLLAFDEGANRRANSGPESFRKRRTRYEIGVVVQEESNQSRLPTEQPVRKRNRAKFCAVSQEKLHKLEMPLRNSACEGFVLCFLADVTARKQFDQAVESPGEYNLDRSCLTVGRNLERLAGTDPFFNLV